MITNYARAKASIASAEQVTHQAWDELRYNEFLTVRSLIAAARIFLDAAEEAIKSVEAAEAEE